MPVRKCYQCGERSYHAMEHAHNNAAYMCEPCHQSHTVYAHGQNGVTTKSHTETVTISDGPYHAKGTATKNYNHEIEIRHCCGAHGFDPTLGDTCPRCELQEEARKEAQSWIDKMKKADENKLSRNKPMEGRHLEL